MPCIRTSLTYLRVLFLNYEIFSLDFCFSSTKSIGLYGFYTLSKVLECYVDNNISLVELE